MLGSIWDKGLKVNKKVHSIPPSPPTTPYLTQKHIVKLTDVSIYMKVQTVYLIPKPR